LSTEASQ